MRVDGMNMTTTAVVKMPAADLLLPRIHEQQPQAKTDAHTPDQQSEPQEVSEAEVIAAIEKANQKLQYYDTRVEFSIHEETRQIMVKIYKNDEVIREIPPEKILDMVAKMIELAGLFVDEKV